MKDLPILMSGDIVRLLLSGKKTQMRRPITTVRSHGKVLYFGKSDTPGYDRAYFGC